MVGTRVFIGGLPFGCREKDLERFCRDCGRIRNVLLKAGYAFVDFEDERDADDAVYELNGKQILGDRVTVEKAKGLPKNIGGGSDYRDGGGRYGGGFSSSRYSPRGGGRGGGWDDRDYGRRGGGGRFIAEPIRTENRIIVENLTTRMSWQDLKDFMRKAGEVTYANAHNQRKNEGVVEFASRKEMLHALETLNGQEINGRKIKLTEAIIPHRRQAGDGGSRSYRSGSRSRSRSRRMTRSRSPLSRSRSKSGSRGAASKSRSRSRSDGGDRQRRSRSQSDAENGH